MGCNSGMLPFPQPGHRTHWLRRGALGLAAAGLGWLLIAGWPAPAAAAPAPPALPYRLGLPGLAADSAAAAVVTQHVGKAVDGSLIVTGEVHNGTADAITSVVVSATANTATRTTTALANQIPPGGNALFQVMFPGVTDANTAVSTSVVSYKAASTPGVFSGLAVALSGVRALVVTVTDPQTGKTTITESSTVLVIPGSLTNNGAQPVTEVSVVLGFYDEDGNVRLVASTTTITVLFREPGDQRLQPGQTGIFEVPFARAAYLGIPGTVRTVAFVSASPASQP